MENEQNNPVPENSPEEPLFREPQQSFPPKKSGNGSHVLTAVISCLVTAAVMLAVFCVIPDNSQHAAFSKLDQLEALISEQFIGDVDETHIEDEAAKAMVDALGDRWSYYISAQDYQAHMDSMNNSYVGVGMTVAVRENGGGIDIRQVSAGGPAQEQGILPGDVLIRVNSTDVTNMDLQTVRSMVVGDEGTDVQLTVLRDKEEKTFTVTRKKFDTPVATGIMLESGYGLIKIRNFNNRCSEETIAAIDELMDQGAKGLIFDVRYNPGGYKHELVKVLDHILPEGILFQSEDFRGHKEKDMSDADHIDIPMMVLVNGESYSAAEFFAAALRDYGVAEIVGTPTVGKGYFQVTTRLSDGSAVGLSIGKYFTPEGVSLAEAGGLTPEYVVEIDDQLFLDIYSELVDPAEDPQIQKAVEILEKN